MLAPRYKVVADRLRSLITEGDAVVRSATGLNGARVYVEPAKSGELHAWIAKVENILSSVFGKNSAHFTHYSKFSYEPVYRPLQYVGDIVPIIGILRGALDDLEGGYLVKQELLVAAALFDDVLSQARHLCNAGYKDPAAVLGRVVIEDALRRLAREVAVDDTGKASAINDELKRVGRLNQPRWREVQTWLDVGNAAAHGRFDQFLADDVIRMLDGIGQFLANEIAA